MSHDIFKLYQDFTKKNNNNNKNNSPKELKTSSVDVSFASCSSNQITSTGIKNKLLVKCK